MAKFVSLVIVFIPLLLLLLGTAATAQLGNSTNATAVFCFGDSTVDAGNNNYLNTYFSIARANHTPYGCDYDNQAPTGRFSNALVLPDLIAQYIGVARAFPFLHPSANGMNLTQGVNFASGGAAIIDKLSSNLVLQTPYTFSVQVEWFRNVTQRLQAVEGATAAASRIRNAFCLISIGSNDFSYKSMDSTTASLSDADFRTLLVNTLSTRIQDIYSIGCRRFIVSAIGPLGCTPITLTLMCGPYNATCRSMCNETTNGIVYAFDVAVENMLRNLSASLSGFRYYYNYDAFNITRDAISNPATYGYTTVDRGCCGSGTTEIGDGCQSYFGLCFDRSKYIFFDAIHPGGKLISLLANRLFPSLSS
ncbi:GDSL esterase/lipase At1g06990-like [Selaginella moellendorffii]|uniref:GDSL esterase/lipase At1g06990-like n=1 Tax=Selaginella moellendorffii TaxID=88036 RepID=UPI000D1C4C77|nr:GDSL esterase/lipase At1g06990-like [Selaginella moellendorffii]|eukprot:XP_024535110.1 GDSL esterase/lipase At1g06990-like [Selaginella moellendorffii]